MKILLGPEVEYGLCDDCDFDNNSKDQVVNRIDDSVNIYLCQKHWDRLKNHPNLEIRRDLGKFVYLA